MADKHLLKFENVSYSYDGNEKDENYAVKGISFTVDKGEFVVILGHNGSGKSTLAKLTNGIFVPDSGKVFVDGMDTSDDSLEFAIRKKIGVVFQNPDNQLVASIVEEDVAFGPENLGIAPKEIRRRVDDALKAVDMYEYRLHETHRLSGGQKQCVAIAGMIAMRPECIVFDEPTAMLDPKGREKVVKTAVKLNKEFGISIIFITHFMEEAVGADKVMVMDNGSILASAAPVEIFKERKLLESCGLDVPDIVKIVSLLKEKKIEMSSDILDEDSFVSEFIKINQNN